MKTNKMFERKTKKSRGENEDVKEENVCFTNGNGNYLLDKRKRNGWKYNGQGYQIQY